MVMLCMLPDTALARSEWEENMTAQALIGAAHLGGLVLDIPRSTDSSTEAGTQYSWMPLVGVSGQVSYLRAGTLTAGLEGCALAGWRSKSITVYGHNGILTLYIDNSLMLFDLSMGIYLSARIGNAGRVYAGAGSLLMFGFFDTDTREVTSEGITADENHDSSSLFGAGMYGRTGIEFRLADRALMGIGVRAFFTKMDFDNDQDDARVKGMQVVVTYTLGL